jgi:hypothetical protein
VKNVAPLSGRVVESADASDHFPLVAALGSVSGVFTHR